MLRVAVISQQVKFVAYTLLLNAFLTTLACFVTICVSYYDICNHGQDGRKDDRSDEVNDSSSSDSLLLMTLKTFS